MEDGQGLLSRWGQFLSAQKALQKRRLHPFKCWGGRQVTAWKLWIFHGSIEISPKRTDSKSILKVNVTWLALMVSRQETFAKDSTRQAEVLIICATSVVNNCFKITNFVTGAFLEAASEVAPIAFLSNGPIDPQFRQTFSMLWSFRVHCAAITDRLVSFPH